ncbi:MAG: glutathione S-transferase family protein [Rhizobiaceae bacterium]
MTLTLHSHPLASFCQKVLIALYENGTPFDKVFVDLGDPAERDRFMKLSPLGLMPVLVDSARGETIAETSIVIDYLDQHFPGPVKLVPDDRDLARAVRAADRFYDLHVQDPMQKIVIDRLRPEGQADPFGVEQARQKLATVYAMIDREMAGRTWAAGDAFSMADCAAAPALFYAEKVQRFDPGQEHLAAYHARLMARPSFARALEEAQPYYHHFPYAKG